jgi:hypothetical protein
MRRRWWVLGVAVLAVLGAASAGWWVAARTAHQTLLAADQVQYPDARPDPDRLPTEKVPVVTTQYRYAQPYSWTVTLVNTSRWSVRVVDIPLDRAFTLLEDESVTIGDRPFRPFTLGAHSRRAITVDGRFANCTEFSVNTSETTVLIRVRFRALGLTRTHDVALPTRLAVHSPNSCPEIGGKGGDASSGGSQFRTINGIVRFTLPDYRLWFTNRDGGSLDNCRIDLDGGARHGGVSAQVARIGGYQAVFVDADRFTGARGQAWDPTGNPPRRIDMACTETGVMTATLGGRD